MADDNHNVSKLCLGNESRNEWLSQFVSWSSGRSIDTDTKASKQNSGRSAGSGFSFWHSQVARSLENPFGEVSNKGQVR